MSVYDYVNMQQNRKRLRVINLRRQDREDGGGQRGGSHAENDENTKSQSKYRWEWLWRWSWAIQQEFRHQPGAGSKHLGFMAYPWGCAEDSVSSEPEGVSPHLDTSLYTPWEGRTEVISNKHLEFWMFPQVPSGSLQHTLGAWPNFYHRKLQSTNGNSLLAFTVYFLTPSLFLV